MGDRRDGDGDVTFDCPSPHDPAAPYKHASGSQSDTSSRPLGRDLVAGRVEDVEVRCLVRRHLTVG